MNKQLVKQIFVESATSLFHERGYENVTVDDISSYCNKNRTSFYHYFKSKEDLVVFLSTIEEENYKKILFELKNAHHNDPATWLRMLLINKMSLLYKSSFFKIAIKNNLFETISELKNIRDDFDKAVLDQYVQIIEKGVKDKVFVSFNEVKSFFQFYQKMQKGIEISLFENTNEDEFFANYFIAVDLAVKAITIQKTTELIITKKEI
jgi:AcrR family transcriptional regulator